jgi:hypothetical protein
MSDIITLFIATIAIVIIKGLLEWSKNNKLPVKSIRSSVLAKNSETKLRIGHGHTGHSDNSNSSSRTIRTITFQSSIDNTRHVFRVNRKVFDLIVEGDIGILVHQGTRYHSFNAGQ